MASMQRKSSWLEAIGEADSQQGISLPPFIQGGMGSAICRPTNADRFVSFKRRLVSAADAMTDGVEWTLWSEADGYPSGVAAFREPLSPSRDRVAQILSILQGWLIDQWSAERAAQVASSQANARVDGVVPPDTVRQEYWLSSDRRFGIIVEDDEWAIYSRGKSLSVWRMRNGESLGNRLPIKILDHLCRWLAKQWLVIAYGKDLRPPSLRERSVAASRAYDDAQLVEKKAAQDELAAWWSRHAFRAGDEELPNVFLERQADELVVSWDAAPSKTRFFGIDFGEEVVPVTFAVPILRQLIRARLNAMSLGKKDKSQLLAATSDGANAAYAILAQYKPSITVDWLTGQGFSENDARNFAVTGSPNGGSRPR